jgi:hypothetical protein
MAQEKLLNGRISDLRKMRKLERLALIKERYRELILEPRRRLEMELDTGYYDSEDDVDKDVEREYAEVLFTDYDSEEF